MHTMQQQKIKQTNIDLSVYKPDYRKYLSSEILYIPYKWFPHSPPSGKWEKSRKNPSKGRPWLARTLTEVKEKLPDILWNPLIQIHAPGSKHRYPCTQLGEGVPKYFTSLIQIYCWLAHMASTLSLDVKVMIKSFIIAQLKMSKHNRQFVYI